MSRQTRKMEWMEHHHQEKAAKTADELIARLKGKPPIDPLAVARTEQDILKTGGGDLGSGNGADGKSPSPVDIGFEEFARLQGVLVSSSQAVGQAVVTV